MVDKLWIRLTLQNEIGVSREKVLFCEHHLSHAASAYLCSPFEEAAILTVDGVGEWVTATYGVGRGNDIRLLRQIEFPHSIGLLYSAFTTRPTAPLAENSFLCSGSRDRAACHFSQRAQGFHGITALCPATTANCAR
jgi:hypothetical protein